MSEKEKTFDEEEIQKLINQRVEEEVAGLKGNRDAILSEKNTLEEQLKSLKSKLDNIDLEKYNELVEKDKLNQLEKEGRSPELAELQLQLDRLTGDLTNKSKLVEDKDQEIMSYKTKLDDLAKNSALTQAFDEAGISSKQRHILLSYFSSKTDIDSTGNVVIKKDDGSLHNPVEFMKEWSSTDSAKPFIDSPYNTGGNSNGSGNSVGVKLDTKSTAELHEMAKEKPHLLPQIEKEMRSRSIQS